MAEIREVVAHKLTDGDVRRKLNAAIATYKRDYPQFQIESNWRAPSPGARPHCEVTMKLTPGRFGTKIKANVSMEHEHLVFIVIYPDVFRAFGDDIAKYTRSFREEVQKQLRVPS